MKNNVKMVVIVLIVILYANMEGAAARKEKLHKGLKLMLNQVHRLVYEEGIPDGEPVTITIERLEQVLEIHPLRGAKLQERVGVILNKHEQVSDFVDGIWEIMGHTF